MKALFPIIGTFLLLISGIVHASQAVQDYSGTINMFKGNQTVAPYFNSAYGYAVFPTIGKGAIGIGGAHGKGQIYTGGAVTGFTSMTQITIGFQLGGQAYSEIIFFKDKRAYEDFTSGNFEFDAQASAIAVTSSVQASVGTSWNWRECGPGWGFRHTCRYLLPQRHADLRDGQGWSDVRILDRRAEIQLQAGRVGLTALRVQPCATREVRSAAARTCRVVGKEDILLFLETRMVKNSLTP